MVTNADSTLNLLFHFRSLFMYYLYLYLSLSLYLHLHSFYPTSPQFCIIEIFKNYHLRKLNLSLSLSLLIISLSQCPSQSFPLSIFPFSECIRLMPTTTLVGDPSQWCLGYSHRDKGTFRRHDCNQSVLCYVVQSTAYLSF